MSERPVEPRGRTCRVRGDLIALAAFFCMVVCVQPVTASVPDEVRFKGGNILFGELKRLERGQLEFDTDSSDSLSIDWSDVESIRSPRQFQVVLNDGRLFFGTIVESAEPGMVAVSEVGGVKVLPMNRVVELTQLEDKLIARFDGSISAGLSLDKSNGYQSYNFAFHASYTTRRYFSSLDASTYSNQSDDADRSEQSDMQLRSSRLFQSRWYSGGLLAMNRNPDQGIDRRTSLGGMVGRSVIHTNARIFRLETGLLRTREAVIESDEVNDSTEMVLGVTFEAFRYDDPEFDLLTRLYVIPNLTESDRTRGVLDLVMRWELAEDLYWKINYQGSYDSDPPGMDSQKQDYSLVSGLAYDF